MVTQGGTLTVTFVNSIDFLNRIKEFEVKYEMNWGEFLAKFTSGKFSTCTEEYSDYTEWAFLCKAFLSDLIQLEGKSPPCKVGTEAGNSEKPELISGFCFLGEQTCLMPNRISKRAQRSSKPAKIMISSPFSNIN